MKRRNSRAQVVPTQVERSNASARQPQTAPYPAAQQACGVIVMPGSGTLPVSGNGMPMGLPVYTSVDEYGRVFNPIITYGPQPHSAPVPIATPSLNVQLTPIVSPVAFVPYATQNQQLYQSDDETTDGSRGR